MNRKLQPFGGIRAAAFFLCYFENRQLYLSLKTLFDNVQS